HAPPDTTLGCAGQSLTLPPVTWCLLLTNAGGRHAAKWTCARQPDWSRKLAGGPLWRGGCNFAAASRSLVSEAIQASRTLRANDFGWRVGVAGAMSVNGSTRSVGLSVAHAVGPTIYNDSVTDAIACRRDDQGAACGPFVRTYLLEKP